MNAPEPPSLQPSPPKPALGLAIATLVLGILAVLLSFLVLGGALGVIGIALGVACLRGSCGARGLAKWGLGLSIVGLAASLAFSGIYYGLYQKFQAAMPDMESADFAEWQGVVAPDITVTTLDGQTIQLGELKGKRVILDFWATWCPPCIKEIPHFVQLASEIPREQLVIVGISDENAETLNPFVRKQRMNYPIASASGLPSPYSDIESIPTTFFIDRKGVIQTVVSGYHDLETLRKHATESDYQGEPKPAPKNSARLSGAQ